MPLEGADLPMRMEIEAGKEIADRTFHLNRGPGPMPLSVAIACINPPFKRSFAQPFPQRKPPIARAVIIKKQFLIR